MPNDKKLEEDGRRGTIMIKSSLIPAGWVIHKPENNNANEVLPRFVKVQDPTSGFPVYGPKKGSGNSQRH